MKCKNRTIVTAVAAVCGLLSSVAVTAASLGPLHSCDKQNDPTLNIQFTIPLGLSIQRVTVDLEFDTITVDANDVTVTPPNETNNSSRCGSSICSFTDFYSTDVINTYPALSGSGYLLGLRNISAQRHLQVLIINKPDGSGTWDGTVGNFDTWTTSLSLTVPGGTYYALAMSIHAYTDAGETNEVTNANLQFTSIDHCNTAPIPVIEKPSAGSTYFTNRGISIKGSAADPNGDSISSYAWTLDGGLFTDGGAYLASAEPAKPIYFGAAGTLQLTFTATDVKTATATPVQRDLIIIAHNDANLQQPYTMSFPKKSSNPPSVTDSNIAGDAGWNFASRLEYQDGTDPYLIMQSIVVDDGTNKDLYLSFEIKDNSAAHNDYIILGFRPDVSSIDASRANDRILILDTSDNSLKVMGNSAAWTETGYSISNAQKNSWYGTGKWYAELKVPLKTAAASGGAQWIDVQDSFLFYFNVIRAQTSSTDQLSWPRYNDLPLNPVSGTIGAFNYSPAEWGDATMTATTRAGGVYLPWADLGTTNADSSHIIFNAPNTFFARVRNDTTIDGTPAPVSGVTAQFRIAQWGFGTGTVAIDGLLGPASIAANGFNELTVNWTPTDANYENNCHQCIWVDVAAPSDVLVKTPSRQKNMDFVSSVTPDVHICPDPPPPPPSGEPVGDGNAVIGDEGQGAPPEGAEENEIIVEVNKEEYVQPPQEGADPQKIKLPAWLKAFVDARRMPAAVAPGSASGTRSYLKWVASGRIFTGKYLDIRGQRVKLYKPLGSFGYVVEHLGEVAGWEEGITGEKVQKIGSKTYRIMLPKDSRTDVDVVIKPILLNGWSLSMHGGLAIPFGSLASNAGLGYAVVVDCGYQVLPQLAVVLQAGFNHFSPAAAGGSWTWAINVSPDIRYLLVPRGSLRPFIGIGPSVLYDTVNGFGYGGNICAGVDYALAPRVDVELGAMYHYLLPNNAHLVQITLGVVYRF